MILTKDEKSKSKTVNYNALYEINNIRGFFYSQNDSIAKLKIIQLSAKKMLFEMDV